MLCVVLIAGGHLTPAVAQQPAREITAQRSHLAFLDFLVSTAGWKQHRELVHAALDDRIARAAIRADQADEPSFLSKTVSAIPKP